MKEIEDAIKVGIEVFTKTDILKNVIDVRPIDTRVKEALRATANQLSIYYERRLRGKTIEIKCVGCENSFKDGNDTAKVDLLRELKQEKEKHPHIGYSIVIENKLKELKSQEIKK